MTYYPPPDGKVVHGAQLPVARHQSGEKNPWWADGLLQFFHKQELEIRPPG